TLGLVMTPRIGSWEAGGRSFGLAAEITMDGGHGTSHLGPRVSRDTTRWAWPGNTAEMRREGRRDVRGFAIGNEPDGTFANRPYDGIVPRGMRSERPPDARRRRAARARNW